MDHSGHSMSGQLIAFLNASPSPFHAVASAAAILGEHGFAESPETASTPTAPGRYFTRRGGSLIAWSTEGQSSVPDGFRVVGAHTDSPNLRIKPQPDRSSAGWQSLGVEVYGGPLLNSWLDRDLGCSGRAVVRAAEGPRIRDFVIDQPILRISQLAIHLDRDISAQGLTLNPQSHLVPHWGVGDSPGDFAAYLADQLDVGAKDLLAWQAMTHDLTPARRIGRERDLVASGRLDNQASCHAGIRALCSLIVDDSDSASDAPVPVVVLFDHEEIGSTSASGAQSTFLPASLERIVFAGGGSRQDYLRAMASSIIASADMAHATHPNYADRHDPDHLIRMNGGPVLKVNAQGRYASDPWGSAAFQLACEEANVPMQTFVNRTDMPCGSTIGPMSAAATGATTVDIGAATLSMHSAREVCGVDDHADYIAALTAFLQPSPADLVL